MTYYFKVDLYFTKNTKQFVQKRHLVLSLSVNICNDHCVRGKEVGIVCQCVATMGWLSQWSVSTVRFEAELTMRRNNGASVVSLAHYFIRLNVDSHWWRNACKIIKAIYYQGDNFYMCCVVLTYSYIKVITCWNWVWYFIFNLKNFVFIFLFKNMINVNDYLLKLLVILILK